MTRIPGRGRRGFTLIELLVVMAIIIALAGMTMLIAPGAANKDKNAATASDLMGAMNINRARAIRDGLPHGVKLIVGNPNNNINGNNANYISTELQHIENPPVFVANPNGPPPIPVTAAAWVQFDYTTNAGSISGRSCTIFNLTFDQATQITNAVPAPGGAPAILSLPTLGLTLLVTSPAPSLPPAADGFGYFKVSLNLNATPSQNQYQYVDSALGGQTNWRTHHFGVYGPARPVLGESTVQLNACVDLGLSSPAGGGSDYDILFGPSGQLVYTTSTRGAGQVFLMIRDQNKPPPPNYTQMGDVVITAIKAKTGAIGTGPLNQDPTNYYFFAAKAISGQ